MKRMVLAVIFLTPLGLCAADPTPHEVLVEQLKALHTNIGQPDKKLTALVPNDIRQRLREANAKSTAAWQKIDSRAAWEEFRAAKLLDLKSSLNWPAERLPLTIRRTGSL